MEVRSCQGLFYVLKRHGVFFWDTAMIDPELCWKKAELLLGHSRVILLVFGYKVSSFPT